jgi:hypothetical protein
MAGIRIEKGGYVQIPHYVTPELCKEWCDLVCAQEEGWETHFEHLHSYGVAWYLEIENGRLHYYHAQAERTNAQLAAIPDLLPILSAVGQVLVGPDGRTGYPVRPRRINLGPYWSDAGLVLSSKGRIGEAHADYEGLAPYPAKLFDSNTLAFSAIISLAVPAQGGNLKLWPGRKIANQDFCEESPSVELVYKVGTLTVFDSFCFHQIQPAEMNEEFPFRMVAGIHFLFIDGPEPHWEHWF